MQATHQSSFGEDDKNVKQVQRLVDQGDEESEVFSVASSLRQARKAGMYKSSRSGSAKSCRAVRFDPAQQDNSTYYEANNYRDNIRDIRQCFPQPVRYVSKIICDIHLLLQQVLIVIIFQPVIMHMQRSLSRCVLWLYNHASP